MKVAFILTLILAFTLGQVSWAQAPETTKSKAESERTVDWEAFSLNLVKAIKSGHPGLQNSAMQQIIRYGDKLNVEDAAWNISRIFRYDDNPQVRRLAMLALHAINTDKCVGYLCQNAKYEDNPQIKKQCRFIIYEYYAANFPQKLDTFTLSELAALILN